jgi:divalent metal cation (Fe/Co/Zn/Cd) transporter
VSSVAFARYESIRKLIDHGHTTHIAVGIAGAVVGIIGNQVVARYKLVVGKRIGSATLIADAPAFLAASGGTTLTSERWLVRT